MWEFIMSTVILGSVGWMRAQTCVAVREFVVRNPTPEG